MDPRKHLPKSPKNLRCNASWGWRPSIQYSLKVYIFIPTPFTNFKTMLQLNKVWVEGLLNYLQHVNFNLYSLKLKTNSLYVIAVILQNFLGSSSLAARYNFITISLSVSCFSSELPWSYIWAFLKMLLTKFHVLPLQQWVAHHAYATLIFGEFNYVFAAFCFIIRKTTFEMTTCLMLERKKERKRRS